MNRFRAQGAWLVAAAAAGASVAIGFVGAPGHDVFDWALFAETLTAFGTLLLAAYTATLRE